MTFGIDRAVLRIDGEQDGALEAVALGQDLGQLRQRLLGAVLLVAADQDDVLALARAVAPFVDDPAAKSESGHQLKARKRAADLVFIAWFPVSLSYL